MSNLKSAIISDRTDEFNLLLSQIQDLSTLEDQNGNTLPILLTTYKKPSFLALALSKFENSLNPAIRNERLSAWLNHRNKKHYSALFYAAGSDQLPILKLLIEKGADFTDKYSGDSSLLHIAAQGGAISCLIFLSNLLPFDAPNGALMTPLMLAAWTDNDSVLRYLISSGANLELGDAAGNRALHIAVSRENVRNVYFLLMAGAKTGAHNRAGLSARDLALGMGNKAMIGLFNGGGLWGWLTNFELSVREMKTKSKLGMARVLFFLQLLFAISLVNPCLLIRSEDRSLFGAFLRGVLSVDDSVFVSGVLRPRQGTQEQTRKLAETA